MRMFTFLLEILWIQLYCPLELQINNLEILQIIPDHNLLL